MSTNRMPRVYATSHPSDSSLHRVMFRDSRGQQTCLIDDLRNPTEAERLARAVKDLKPLWLFEAKEAVRRVYDGPTGEGGV